MAHEIPYVATATVADLRDLEAKVEHAMTLRGARYIHVLVTCPLGWGSASRDTVRIARLACETGLFPVFEAAAGDVVVRHEDPPPPAGAGVPASAAALRPPVRARGAHRRDRQDPGQSRPQHRAIRAAVMAKPFAITLDVGSSRANKTGSWRTERPGYVHRLPPCNHGCPAGENCQQWLYHAEGGDYEAAWRQIMADNPLPAVMGRVCYHPCETACNRGELDEAVGINAVERFLGDEGIRQRLDGSRSPRRRPASACSSSAPGPPGSRPPITSRSPATR